jgi:hypothetical protein
MAGSRTGISSLHMPRTRGVVSGLLLIILGAWGALIPFIGPIFHWAYTPDQQWFWTAARGWLEVFPGVTTVVGGLLLVGSGNRATAMFGGWLAAFAGAWFVVGRACAPVLQIGDVGHPVAATDAKRALLEITYFSGLGALIVFLSGAILARLSVRSARDAAALAPAADVPAEEAAAPGSPYASEYSMIPAPDAPAASPDAVTQAREGEFPAEKRERGKHNFLRRRRKVDAG